VVSIDVIEVNAPVRKGRARASTAPGAAGPGVALNVDITAPRGVFVRGRGLDLELSLDATVRGNTAKPVLAGVARVVRGSYEFAGKRFEFDDRGTVRLATTPEDIRLDLTAVRDDPSLTARVRVTGTAAEPIIALSSTPQLPQDEILSQVLFGRSASQLSALEAAQLASALTSLATGGGFDVIGGLRSLAGLDRLSLGGGAGGPTIAGGKYLTDDVYLEIIGGAGKVPARRSSGAFAATSPSSRAWVARRGRGCRCGTGGTSEGLRSGGRNAKPPAMHITVEDRAVLDAIAERGPDIVDRAIGWCAISSGSATGGAWSSSGRCWRQRSRLCPGCRAAPAPASIEIGADGREREQPHPGRAPADRAAASPRAGRHDRPLRHGLSGGHRLPGRARREDGALNGPGIADMKGGSASCWPRWKPCSRTPPRQGSAPACCCPPTRRSARSASAPRLAGSRRGGHVGLTYEPAQGGALPPRKGRQLQRRVRGRAATRPRLRRRSQRIVAAPAIATGSTR
jgi:hypothetical protein